jgi:sarcosine oxidase subunit beta
MTQSKKPGLKLGLAIQSSNVLWPNLADELGCDIEYVQKGSMLVMEAEEEVEFIKKFSQAQRKYGLPVEFLDQKETRKLQPAISPHILASTFCPIDGEVNPFYLLGALVTNIRGNGGRVHIQTAVTGFKVDDGRITHVVTDKGVVETSVVVCAAGVDSVDMGKMLDVAIPIKPRRRQVLITEATAPLIGPYVMSARTITAKHTNRPTDQGESKYDEFSLGMIISQTVSGNVVLGGTYEFAGYDKHTTVQGVTGIARYTSMIIPALRGLKVIRSFSGLRPFTDDGVPIIGPMDKIPNFIVAAGHEGDGVAVAPATGREVSEKLIQGLWPER